jgi:ATP-binding cassette, subfamily B, bacterial
MAKDSRKNNLLLLFVRKLKHNPFVFLTSQTWKYSAGNRAMFLLFVILQIGTNVTVFLEPLVLAKLLNTIQEQGVVRDNIVNLLMILSIYFILEFVAWLFHGPARILEEKNAFYVGVEFRKKMLKGILHLPMMWHQEQHSGDIIDKLSKSYNAIREYSQDISELQRMFIRFISAFIALVFFNLNAAYIIIFAMIMAVIIVSQFDRKIMKRYDKINKFENSIAAKVHDTLTNISSVIILHIEKLMFRNLYYKMNEPLKITISTQKLEEFKWFFVSMVVVLMKIVVIGSYIVIIYLSDEVLLIGTLTALYLYVDQITHVFYEMTWRYGYLVKKKVQLENIVPVTNEFNKHKIKKEFQIQSDWKEIDIRGLTFDYENNYKNPVLNNINLTIQKGEKVALIGESGCGKTTILKLIRGLYEPMKLELCVNNKFKGNDFSKISDSVMLIPQDPEVFATTIRENVTMGISFPKGSVEKYTSMARFRHVVDRLPKGFESEVNEKGVNLSGGERQRLALSRALLAANGKQILLMDESTSSVDPHNEMLIYEQVFEDFQDRTVIATIHKFNLLKYFDRIIMFEKGQIVANGTFEELIQNNKSFAKKWKKYENSI